MWCKCLLSAAGCVCVWSLLAERAWSQSVVGAGTVPALNVGQGTGSGTPQGVLAAAGHVVHGVPVGIVRARISDGVTTSFATVEVDCIHSDGGNRMIIGGPIRSGRVTSQGFDITHLYLVVEDNGLPVNGEPVDRALAIAAIADACDLSELIFLIFDILYDSTEISHGNYTIRAGGP